MTPGDVLHYVIEGGLIIFSAWITIVFTRTENRRKEEKDDREKARMIERAARDEEIRILFRKHDEDVTQLRALELKVASDYHTKGEIAALVGEIKLMVADVRTMIAEMAKEMRTR